MRKKYIFGAVFALAVITVTNFVDFSSETSVKNNFARYSQKKEFVKGVVKQDSPNEYAKYYRLLTTEIGESSPKYSGNYKFEEYEKAIKRMPFSKKSDLTWVSRGPGNIGGRARGIIIDPDDASANTWFIAAVGGGVWKTTDAGENWRNLTSKKGNLSASYMAMAESNHDVIYLGTGEGFGNLDALGGQGIWKSIDRGESWSQLANTTSKSFGIINRIIVDPSNENILLAVTSISYSTSESYSAAIYKSTDGGATWIKKESFSSAVQQIVADPTNFSIQYATVNGVGIYKSTNSGDTWSKIKALGARIEIAIAPTNTSRIYASVAGSGGENSSIHISSDAGVSWVKVNSTTNFLGGQGWYDNAIVVNPYDENVFFVAGVAVFRLKYIAGSSVSQKILVDVYGSHGSAINKGTHVDNHYFKVAKLNDANKTFRIVGTNDGGMCFTDDEGTTFKQPNAGFVTSQFYGVDKVNGEDQYIGGMQDNSSYYSPVNADDDSNWKLLVGGDGFDAIWNYSDKNKLMVTSQFNGLVVTHTGAADFNFGAWPADIDKGRGNAPFISKLAQSKQYTDLVFAHGISGVWRTEDFGINWEAIKMPFGYDGTSSANETKISLVNPKYVWSGASITSNTPMFLSQDYGESFTAVKSSNKVDSYLSGFATHPIDEKTAYALFSTSGNPKIMRTTDLGQTWTDISGFDSSTNGESTNGFPDVAVFDLLVNPINTNTIWVGTEIGIIESTDNGATWNYANNGMPPVAIYELIIVNDEVVMGTHGRGVWSVSLPELQGYEPVEVGLPSKIASTYRYEDGKQYSDLEITYRSNYSKVEVFHNDVLIKEISGVTEGGSVNLSVEVSENNNLIKVLSTSDNDVLVSEKYVDVLPLKATSHSFVTDFNTMYSVGSEFYGDGFRTTKPSGFSDRLLMSQSDYEVSTEYLLYLRTPITVNKDNPTVSYSDVAIIENGETGSAYPQESFYDYVTVEGSVDGTNWKQLVTPYDCSYNADWKTLYGSGGDPTKSNFVGHSFKTTDFFAEGDVILIRFKLFSDPGAVGWGWAIDNLEIQNGALSLENNAISSEFKIYPNPAVNETLYVESSSATKISGVVFYNLKGQVVLNKSYSKTDKIELNVSDLSAGEYLLKVDTEKGSFSKKILVK